jgi:hypothetical protein
MRRYSYETEQTFRDCYFERNLECLVARHILVMSSPLNILSGFQFDHVKKMLNEAQNSN